ncbi:DoxX family membrane protein [Nocardia violaceofusca]|uniref:DoxX family membrane protein n=1 Tax=Nocardia violaceofusca TaxID=941182 RepID=UPI0007A3C661|nr:DoxX family membrane protein [Nocardia violaceofusca]
MSAIRKFLPLPGSAEQIVKANGAVQAVGGALLTIGVAPRLSAASLVPTTIAGHNFWAIEDPAARKLQQVQHHKKMAMLGSLLFAVAGDDA